MDKMITTTLLLVKLKVPDTVEVGMGVGVGWVGTVLMVSMCVSMIQDQP